MGVASTTAGQPWKVSKKVTSKNNNPAVTLATGGTFVDRDIEIDIEVQEAELSGSGNVTSTDMTLLETAPSGDHYSVTGSGNSTVTTPGWIDNSTTGGGSKTKYVKKSTVSASGSSTANPNATVNGMVESASATDFYVEATASGSYSATGTVTEGYIDRTTNSSAATGAATAGTPVKKYIQAATAAADVASADVNVSTADGSNAGVNISGVLGAKVSTEPSSGYYVSMTASGGGSSKITKEGYIKTGSLASSNTTTTKFFPITAATFANAATSGKTYTDNSSSAPVLVAGDYLYINEGYTPNQKISLAKLVPDGSTVGTSTTSSWLYNTEKMYNDNGALVTGTMGNATVPVSATISALDFTYDSTNKRYNVSKTQAISKGSVTAGYISGTKGTVSGNAVVSATVAETGLSHALVADTSKTAGYSVYRATATAGYNASAKTSDITVYQGEWS